MPQPISSLTLYNCRLERTGHKTIDFSSAAAPVILTLQPIIKLQISALQLSMAMQHISGNTM